MSTTTDESALAQLHSRCLSESTAYRIQHAYGALRIDGIPFSHELYPFWVAVYDDQHPYIVQLKCAQIGATAMHVLRSLDRVIAGLYPRGVGYVFPNLDAVSSFVKSRFNRMLHDNPQFAAHIRRTDSVNMKQVGPYGAFYHFPGARSDVGLKQFPADAMIFDERDEMEDAMVDLGKQRTKGSPLATDYQTGHYVELSTPKFPNLGVSATFNDSDQRYWYHQCGGCNDWTSLEQSWPFDLEPGDRPPCIDIRDDGTVEAICIKCGRTLQRFGSGPRRNWVAAQPDKTRIRGYHISQLNSCRVPLLEIWEEWCNPRLNLAEFSRSRLGRAYAEIDDQLSEPIIRNSCTKDRPALDSEHATALGVDVGKRSFHWIVGPAVTEHIGSIIAFGETDYADPEDFEHKLADLANRYKVACGVIDAMYSTSMIMSVCRDYAWAWGCQYSQRKNISTEWDGRQKLVSVNRTTSLDTSHQAWVRDYVQIPRWDERMRRELVPQLINMARVVEAGKKGRPAHAIWYNPGTKNDHYRHANNYWWMALEKTPSLVMTRRRELYGAGRADPAPSGWVT